jgi:hypothetical protein
LFGHVAAAFWGLRRCLGHVAAIARGLRLVLGHVATAEEFALQKSTKTRANAGNAGLMYAPRAFLRFFITNTFNHRLLAFVALPHAQVWHGLAQSSVPWWLKTTIKVVAAYAIPYWASGLFHS